MITVSVASSRMPQKESRARDGIMLLREGKIYQRAFGVEMPSARIWHGSLRVICFAKRPREISIVRFGAGRVRASAIARRPLKIDARAAAIISRACALLATRGGIVGRRQT